MPISDEVIELAPVKKTKKTLIILIAAMGACFALAVAFLVMYLIKPSVTEDTNHVKDITLVATELFSETDTEGNVKYYASIGNEYTVYSTLTVDNNSSTNVQWDFDPTLLEIKEQKNDGEPYLKFIPRVGTHGKTAKITVRAPSQVSEYKTIEVSIVSQGAEDIQVKRWGVNGNLTTVNGDNIDNDLDISVSYYTMSGGSDNNKSIIVQFEQLTKQDPTSKEYAKLTSVETTKNGPKTDDVTVTSSDESVISILQDTVSNGSFSFDVKKLSDQPVTITIKANVYNASCGEVTKTIRVKVESNGARGFVDSIYVFNKPIVDGEFIAKVQTSGNAAVIDSQKLKTEVANANKAGGSIKIRAKNDSQVVSNTDFELVLPYSYNSTVTYNDIFKHVLLNPLNIQYNGEIITTDWYKNIEVKSSDNNMLQVTTAADGSVKLYPRNVGKCNLTFTDKKPGSAGASISQIPVRIVTQTTELELACGGNKTTLTEPDIEVVAAVNGKYEVNVNYTFVGPDGNPKTFAAEDCLNNKYKLSFDKKEMEVTIKNSTQKLEPDTEYPADYGDTLTKVGSGSSSTTYKATITFVVTVKMDSTGAAKFTFIKNGSDLYASPNDTNSLKSKDKAFELSASFQITESATKAWFIKDEDVKDEGGNNKGLETALNLVTDNGTLAGNFVRVSDTAAQIYVQNRASGTPLSIVSVENLAKLVRADKAFFTVYRDSISAGSGNGVTWNNNDKKLSFNNATFTTSGSRATTVNFEVHNVGGNKIGSFQLDIHIVDAATELRTVESKPTVKYDARANASQSLAATDITVVRVIDDTPKNYTCTDVNLYYGNGVAFTKVSDGDDYIFKHDNKELYKYETGSRKLSILTDIYAYSYEKNINFGEVDLECLLREDEEYLGKHFGTKFDYKHKTHFQFERIADDAALFTDANYQNEVTVHEKDGFNVSVNQDTDAFLYATSIVTIGSGANSTNVYVESDVKGHIAPVQKATFSVPQGITPATKDESPTQGRYYSITYRSPAITEQFSEYKFAYVYYADTQTALMFTVNNVTRKISSIGIYSDAACTTGNSLAGKSLLFGGFINQANRYFNIVYVKVSYENHQSSFTSFEGAELSLPSYLTIEGRTADSNGNNTYTLIPATYSTNNNYEPVYTCKLVLDKEKQLTADKTVKVVPSDNKGGDKSVEFYADVQAGLKSLTVKNGNDEVATITAGETGTYNIQFNLKKPSDAKSLSLSFVYGATNSEGYSLAYDHTGEGLKVTAPTVVGGFVPANNIKAATSTFTITTTDSIATGEQTIRLTFTDEYNGASANNVFTFEIKITVTIDIYELAFGDNTNTTLTVYEGSDGAQTLTVNVKYNGGKSTTQPNTYANVLGVYTKNEGGGYDEYTGGDIVIAHDDVNTEYTVTVANSIDRSQIYYLRLVYGNVTYDGNKHLLAITINTLTSHIEFDKDNSIKPAPAENEPCPTASIVVKSASDEFSLKANVVNDGSGNKESETKQSQVNYGLYTDFNCNNAIITGITVDNGVIKLTNPEKISDTIYYRAMYRDGYTQEQYTLKVKLTYTVAPSAVAISDVDANAFDSVNSTLTLYYGNASNYTQADLSGKIVASTAFSGAAYNTENVVYTVALQNSADAAYLDVSGKILKPKALNANADTIVPIVVTATYAGIETDEKVYNVIIKPVAALMQGSGELNLLNKYDQLTVTPNIGIYNGFTHTYTLSASAADNGVFAITGGDTKTVKLAEGTTAKKGDYKLTAVLSYEYSATANGGITAVGTFGSTAFYTVTVIGEYSLDFDLMAGNDVISPYVNTEDKYSVVNESIAYSVKVTSDDTDFVATSYKATRTPAVVSIGTFDDNNTATVTLIETASGAFSITVTATVGGQTYTATKNYYFVYGTNIVAKLYVSNNGTTYSEFNESSQNIDYTISATQYTFKYEITGVPGDGIADVVVNGNVETSDVTAGDGTRYWIITASKPTTMRIGASVNIGSRTVYLGDKTVELTTTAPNFTLTANNEVLPAGTATFVVNAATGFQGDKSISYAVISGGAYATINATSGVLTAAKNVLTDQTVIVRATIQVNNGAYEGTTYTVDRAITVTGVALPTITWKDSANKVLCTVGADNYSYSLNDYTFNNNGTYDYTGKVTIELSAENGTLTKGTDFTFDATNRKLTLKGTNKTRAGGSLLLKVTAKIDSGAHAGESVSDVITVRVQPTMSTTTSSITLGNAAATYDLNGTRFLTAFAPNTYSGEGFVRPTDSYSIVSLSVSDTTNFGVDGAKLTVKNNLTDATTVNVTATVLITSGAYAGTTVTDTKTVNIVKPTAQAQSVLWNSTDNNYSNITLAKAQVLGNGISGNVSGITVIVPEAVTEYVTVANNGGASPIVSVSKNYGAYFTADAPTKTFTVNYVVTLDNGNVYYSSAQYTVPPQKVTITAKIGEETVGDSGYTVNANETFIMQLTADKGFDVVITAVPDSTLFNTTFGGNGVQFNVGSVNTNQNLDLTLDLNVAGQSTSLRFKLNILAPQTNAQYTANNTENTSFAVNNGELHDQDNAVTSVWTAAGNAQFKYGQKLTITAPNGHNLDEYFDSLMLVFNGEHSADNLNGNSTTINFPVNTESGMFGTTSKRIQAGTFNLNMRFKTNAEITLSTIEVKFTVYNKDKGGSYTDVTVRYRVQVIGAVAVTLNTNAGDDNVEVSYDNPLYKHSYNLPEPEQLTRTGYTLDGWYTAEKGGSKVAANAIVTNTQPHTLYAHWSAKEYTIEYNNEGSTSTRTEKAKYGSTYGVLDTPTRTGYDFVCWKDGEGNVITANTLVQPANANTATKITLTAQWSIKYCTVTLDENYTDGSVFTFQVPYGQSFNVHNSFRPTRDGYRFDGWNVSGDVTNVTSNVTMTARWIKLYTVGFDLNNTESTETFEGIPYDENAVYGTLPTPANTATKNFTGWELADGTAINSTSQVTGENAQITLYAQWTTLATYTVSFNTHTDDVTAPQGITVVNTREYGELPALTRARYTFNGWFTQETGGERVTSATVVNLSADQTLHAQWTQVECLVTLNAGNDGTVLGETSYSFTVAKDAQFSTHLNVTPTRTGYRFDGWMKDEQKQTAAITVTGDVTLTAKWVKQYTVSFNLNNTESDEEYESRQYDEGDVYGTLPTPANTATKNFTGWSLTEDGSVIDGATATVTGANAQITLYAQWTDATSYSITFESRVSGMTVDPASKTVYVGRKYGDLPTLTRDNYTFDGWYLSTHGDDVITSDSTVDLAGNTPLYAHWTKVVFTVTLNAGEGKIMGDDRTYATKVATGQSYDLHLMITPTRDGYRFDGWWINGVGEEADVKQESAITVTDDVTLNAKWIKLYTVTFVNNVSDETPVAQQYDEGAKYGRLPTLQDIDNKHFEGWSLTENGEVINGDTATIGGENVNIPLYAVWSDNTPEGPTGD